jgi:allophanate hydrolase subunit 2
VEAVLGSASTCLAGGFGGLAGRALRGGDRLAPVRAPGAASPGRHWLAGGFDPLDPAPIAIVATAAGAGVQRDWLADLLASTWLISPQADRTGVRLEGPTLPSDAEAGSLVSRGMAPGAIQVPPDGQPIVLLADGPTVGGYPVAAVVAGVDLARLAQRATATDVRFVAVSASEAQALWRARAAQLDAAVMAMPALDPRWSGV